MRLVMLALLATYSVLGTGCIQTALIAGGGALAYDSWQQRKTNERQDAQIGSLMDSLKATDDYIASKPWQTDIEAYNASKAIHSGTSANHPSWMPHTSPMAIGRVN